MLGWVECVLSVCGVWCGEGSMFNVWVECGVKGVCLMCVVVECVVVVCGEGVMCVVVECVGVGWSMCLMCVWGEGSMFNVCGGGVCWTSFSSKTFRMPGEVGVSGCVLVERH